MNITETLNEADLEKADAEAVMEHFLHGKPIAPEVDRRVHGCKASVFDPSLLLPGS